MHADKVESAEWSLCWDNASDYSWELTERPVSQLNRNAMICDLHQTGIYKKVLRKGSFKLIFR